MEILLMFTVVLFAGIVTYFQYVDWQKNGVSERVTHFLVMLVMLTAVMAVLAIVSFVSMYV